MGDSLQEEMMELKTTNLRQVKDPVPWNIRGTYRYNFDVYVSSSYKYLHSVKNKVFININGIIVYTLKQCMHV